MKKGFYENAIFKFEAYCENLDEGNHVMFGVARRYEDHEESNCMDEESFCLYFYNGLVYADGKKQPQGNAVNQGDKIGVVLDMDDGELSFFHND